MEAGQHQQATATQAAAVAPQDSEAASEDPDGSASSATTEDASSDAVVEAKPDAEPTDPDTAKRVAAVQRAEKRAREQLAKERAELEQRTAEITKKSATVDRLEKLMAQADQGADVDILEAMEALGVKPERRAHVARVLYANRPDAKPEERSAATELQRTQATSTAAERALKEVEALRAEIQQRDQQAAYQQAWSGFMADVSKVDVSNAPLFKSALAKNPARIEKSVRDISAQLLEQNGEWPDAADVVATYEKQRRDELADYGVDLDTITAKPLPKPATGTNGNAVPPPKTLGASMNGATTVPKDPKLTLAERRAETTRLMEQGKLD